VILAGRVSQQQQQIIAYGEETPGVKA